MASKNKSVDAVFKELDALEKKLATKIIRQGQRAGAKILAAEIKAQAPVETGAVKRSVKVRAGKRRKGQVSTIVEVSGDPEEGYIGFIEFGTKDHVANPFIRKSALAKTNEVVDKIRDAIEAGITKGG